MVTLIDGNGWMGFSHPINDRCNRQPIMSWDPRRKRRQSEHGRNCWDLLGICRCCVNMEVSIVMVVPPIAGWFMSWKIPSFEMDDDWGYLYDSGNLHMEISKNTQSLANSLVNHHDQILSIDIVFKQTHIYIYIYVYINIYPIKLVIHPNYSQLYVFIGSTSNSHQIMFYGYTDTHRTKTLYLDDLPESHWSYC